MNPLFRVAVPPASVTDTLTAPALPAGVTAVIDVALFTVYEVAFTPPNFTPAAPETLEKFVPVMVTEVPPAVDPLEVDSEVMVGGAT